MNKLLILISTIMLSGCDGLLERTELRWVGECLEEKTYDLNEVKEDWHRIGCFPCIRADFRHAELGGKA